MDLPRSESDPSRLRRRDGRSVAEAAIFDATEKLLAEYSLRDLSVAQIIAEAGLSRATFYFYFGSKFSVAASLLGRITDETFELVQPYVSGDRTAPPDELLARSLKAAVDIWERHRP